MPKARKIKRNPIRATGAFLMNPKRKKAVAKRGRPWVTTPVKKAVAKKATKATHVKPARDYKNVHHTEGLVREHYRRVKNPVPFRRFAALRRPALAKRIAFRRAWLAHHPKVAARILNPKKKPRKGKRKNPGMVASTISSAQGVASKIPLIGGLLSSALGYIVPMVLGAIGVEPTMQLAKFTGQYVPNMNSSLFYLGTGIITAALAKMLLPKTGFVSGDMAGRIALAIASGAGAVAYYKHRSGDSKDMGSEMGALEVAMGDGFGFAEAIAPLGMFGGLTDGGVDVGAIEAMYSGATAQDVADAPGDLDYGELETVLAGPRAWRKRYGKPGKGGMAHKKGHRHGWLIHLLGYEKVQELAKLDPETRRNYIAQIKAEAVQKANALLSAGSPAATAQEMGALALAY